MERTVIYHYHYTDEPDQPRSCGESSKSSTNTPPQRRPLAVLWHAAIRSTSQSYDVIIDEWREYQWD